MSEPFKTQNFIRYGWLSYDSEENCKESLQRLENANIPGTNFNLAPVRSTTKGKHIRITPPLADDCVERDLDLCRKLIEEVLDKEKKIDFAFDKLDELASKLKKVQQLDLFLLYLRRVHSYCFYCGEEYDDERMLASKCGP